MKNNKRIVAIDFFCGVGGMTHGLIMSGIDVIAGIDNQSLCETSFRQNKNKDKSRPQFVCMNIFPRDSAHPDGQQKEIIEQLYSLLADYKRRHKVRKLKLIFSICAPCQPFTKITKIEMSERRKYRRQNDSNLLIATMPFIREFRPDAVIVENVEGMGKDNGDSVLDKFNRAMSRNGYSFESKVIDTANFGVPQHRRRTIGISVDMRKYDAALDVPECDESIKKYMTVREAIGHLPPLAAGESHADIPNHRARALSPLNLKRISSAPAGGSNAYLKNTPYGDLSLDCHRRMEKRWGKSSFSDTYTRLSPDEVGPTITTKCIAISNGRFGHYDIRQNRGLTPREAALLQTFPENYIFYPVDSIEFAALVIGNAVPPRLAKFLGKYVAKAIAV